MKHTIKDRPLTLPIMRASAIFGEGPITSLEAWASVVRDYQPHPDAVDALNVEAWSAFVRQTRNVRLEPRGFQARLKDHGADFLEAGNVMMDEHGVPWIFVARASVRDTPWRDPAVVPPRARIIGQLAARFAGSAKVGYFGPPQVDSIVPVNVALEQHSETFSELLAKSLIEWWTRFIAGRGGPVEPPATRGDARVVGYLYPASSMRKAVELSEEHERLVLNLHAAESRRRAAEAESEALVQRLKQVLGTAEVGVGRKCRLHLEQQYRGGYRQLPSSPRILRVELLRAG